MTTSKSENVSLLMDNYYSKMPMCIKNLLPKEGSYSFLMYKSITDFWLKKYMVDDTTPIYLGFTDLSLDRFRKNRLNMKVSTFVYFEELERYIAIVHGVSTPPEDALTNGTKVDPSAYDILAGGTDDDLLYMSAKYNIIGNRVPLTFKPKEFKKVSNLDNLKINVFKYAHGFDMYSQSLNDSIGIFNNLM